jgi:two-component system sensor histidine kinase/response regulator
MLVRGRPVTWQFIAIRAFVAATARSLQRRFFPLLSVGGRLADQGKTRGALRGAHEGDRSKQRRTLNQDSLTAEAQLRSLIDQAPVAVAMFDRHMRYVAVSSRWLRDYRIDAPVLGRSHYEIFPEIPEGWKDIHRRTLAGETVTESEDRFDRADGAVQWLAWTVQPWIEPNGVIGGIIICSEDVTARKKADAERELFCSGGPE